MCPEAAEPDVAARLPLSRAVPLPACWRVLAVGPPEGLAVVSLPPLTRSWANLTPDLTASPVAPALDACGCLGAAAAWVVDVTPAPGACGARTAVWEGTDAPLVGRDGLSPQYRVRALSATGDAAMSGLATCAGGGGPASVSCAAVATLSAVPAPFVVEVDPAGTDAAATVAGARVAAGAVEARAAAPVADVAGRGVG